MFTRYFSKTIITLITILSLLSLVSIGFASWTIAYSDVDNYFDGSVTVDKVVNSLDFIEIDNEKFSDGISPFKYYEYGFLDDDNFVTNVGVLKVYFKLNIQNIINNYGDYNSVVELTIKLKYNCDLNYDIIKNMSNDIIIGFDNKEIPFNQHGIVVTNDNFDSYHISNITFDINELLNDDFLSFYIEYHTNEINQGQEFKNNVYFNLEGMSFKIDTYVNIYDKEVN